MWCGISMNKDPGSPRKIMPDEMTPELRAEITGLPLYQARFIDALERGEIHGNTLGAV